MHILIVTYLYTPDLGPSAPLFATLSKALVNRGHQVTVIAAVPHYPTGKVQPGFGGKWINRSVEDGVEVVRVNVPSLDRGNLVKRFVQLAAFQIGATWASLREECDVALFTNPSLATWLPFAWQIVIKHKPIVYSVFDIYPDVGIKLGIFRHKPVIKFITSLERFCLDNSESVQILCESFRPGLRALGVPDSKMDLVDLWVDTELIRPFPRNNTFTREYGLDEHFVVLYAGNIGLSQGLEHVLATAELLADIKDVAFVLVGDGTGCETLQSQAKQRKLSNVQFIPFQPRQRLPEVLACADVSLVILKRGFGSDSLPSKTFSILASGRPLIASVDEASETWKLVKRAKAGLCVPPEDPAKLARAILTLRQDEVLCEILGHNGRDWVERYHSPQYAVTQFEHLLSAAISSKDTH
jgi:colanic acid biosynthesis glycosyl transferase WcaI